MSDRLLSAGTQQLIEAGAGSDHDEAYDHQLQHDLGQALPHEEIAEDANHQFHLSDKTAQQQAGLGWIVRTQSGGRKPVDKF